MMGTEIPSLRAKWGTVRLGQSAYGGALYVEAPEDGTSVSRLDFLAAVETECGVRMVPADAIVIDRAELPKIVDTVKSGGAEWYAFADGRSRTILVGDEHYDRAVAFLAAREYALAHPPTPTVDEADVVTLAGLVDEAGVRVVANASSRLIARRLLATGRVSVTHE